MSITGEVVFIDVGVFIGVDCAVEAKLVAASGVDV